MPKVESIIKETPRDDKPISPAMPVRSSEPAKKEAAKIPVPSASPPLSPEPSSNAGLPLPFDPVFYTWREVDVPAKLSGSGSPPYPKNADVANISGRVIVEVWVDENGKVDDAKVLDADPPGYFEEATLSYYKKLRFTPAMKGGKQKRYRTRFMVDFGEPLKILDTNTEQKSP